ncbi:hypothetical protein ACJJTC_009395 [Scirpophaga incertulas]
MTTARWLVWPPFVAAALTISAVQAKECLTVLLTVAADGAIPPPLIMFPYKRYVPSYITANMPKGWGMGHSDSGWMTNGSQPLNLLSEVEARLPTEVVNKFKNVDSEIDLDERFLELYKFWKNIQSEKNISMNESTFQNNLPSNLNQTISDIIINEEFWLANDDAIEATVETDGNTGIGTQKRRYSDWVPAIYEQRCRFAHNTYRASKRAHSMRSGNVAALCRLARPAGGLREQSKQTQNIVFFDCDWPRITFVGYIF